jgi:hypothetical protein
VGKLAVSSTPPLPDAKVILDATPQAAERGDLTRNEPEWSAAGQKVLVGRDQFSHVAD